MVHKKIITRRKALAGIGLLPMLATWAFEGISHPKTPQTSIYDDVFLSRLLRVLDEQGALWDCPPFTDRQQGFLTEQFAKMAPSTYIEAAIFAAIAEQAHSPHRNKMQTEIVEEYVRRRNGNRPLMPDHSILSLEGHCMPQTYRLLIFREQVTKLLETLTCLPSDKSDRLRKDLMTRKINVTSAQFKELASPDHKNLTDKDYDVIDWNLNVFICCFGLSCVWASTMVSRAEAF
jgi:hypothetical protein